MTEEEALWQAIGANPEDQLPRKVLADWYEDRSGWVDCEKCGDAMKDGQKVRKGYVANEFTPGHHCPRCGKQGTWRRGVHFDHEMRCGSEACIEVNGSTHWEPGERGWWPKKCPTCDGTGRVSNGYTETAAALRATADRVPRYIDHSFDERAHAAWWWCHMKHPVSFNEFCNVGPEFNRLTGRKPESPIQNPIWRYYLTAAAAIRDLCEAWCKEKYGEAPS